MPRFAVLLFRDSLMLNNNLLFENFFLIEVYSLALRYSASFFNFMLQSCLLVLQSRFLSDVIPQHLLLLVEFGGSRQAIKEASIHLIDFKILRIAIHC